MSPLGQRTTVCAAHTACKVVQSWMITGKVNKQKTNKRHEVTQINSQNIKVYMMLSNKLNSIFCSKRML